MRDGTTTPRRASSSWIFTPVRSSATQPRDDLVLGHEPLPPIAVTVAAMGTHDLDHRGDELVAQLADTTITGQAELDRCSHVRRASRASSNA